MKTWKVKHGTHGGLIIETTTPDGRRVASFPTIPKWYHKSAWPWVIVQSIKAIKAQYSVSVIGETDGHV